MEPRASKIAKYSEDRRSNRSSASSAPVYKWSAEQQRVIEAAVDGRHVFMTGPGGVGKSAIIPYLVQVLTEEHNRRVCVTATTGVAAVALSGMTLHAFVGAGLANEPIELCIGKVMRNRRALERWRKTDVLVIDEVSMLAPSFFEKIALIAKAVRGQPGVPFGGMQLIMSGDFLQLPPVLSNDSTAPRGLQQLQLREPAPASHYLFLSPVWKSLDLCVVKMEQSFRQVDSAFVALLNRARYGALTSDDCALLNARVNAKLDVPDKIVPTRIYARSAAVETENATELAKCKGPEHCFVARYADTHGVVLQGSNEYGVASKSFNAEPLLRLRVGAQVMLVANVDVAAGLANGSRGVVIGFDKVPIEIDDDDDDDDDNNDKHKGAGARQTGPAQKSSHASNALDDLATKGGSTMYPIVMFCNRQVRVIDLFAWERDCADGSRMSCHQVPLKLAWAITVHKAQGVSLDCGQASIDESIFEYGQSYVALSRFRNLKGMTLAKFSPDAVRANPTVVDYYNSIK